MNNEIKCITTQSSGQNGGKYNLINMSTLLFCTNPCLCDSLYTGSLVDTVVFFNTNDIT